MQILVKTASFTDVIAWICIIAILERQPWFRGTKHNSKIFCSFLLQQWFSSFFSSRRTVKHKNFLAHFVYKIKNILMYFKWWIKIKIMDVINLYTNGFLLSFKKYFHNIRDTRSHLLRRTVWDVLVCSCSKLCPNFVDRYKYKRGRTSQSWLGVGGEDSQAIPKSFLVLSVSILRHLFVTWLRREDILRRLYVLFASNTSILGKRNMYFGGKLKIN
jgi:hypothetical protein